METISKVRLAHLRKGLSIREISRLYNLSRNTVRKILRADVIDQKYVRSVQPLRKLGSFEDRLLALDHLHGFEAAVLPRHQQVYVSLCDCALVQQHLQKLVPEELFQCVAVVVRGDMKAAIFIKAAVSDDNVAMGIKAKEIAEGLNGAGAAGDGVVQTAAVEVTVDGLPYFRTQIPVLRLIPLFMNPLQFLETILDTAVIVG